MSDGELRDELVTVVGAGPRDDRDRRSPGRSSGCCATPRVLARLRESIAAGEDDYLDATIKETLRARPVIVDVARKLTAPAEIGGYELPAGTFVLPAIAGAALPRGPLPGARRVPARALPRRQAPTTTPGSRSAAACGAASAPPSPSTRCGSSCARSSSAPTCAPPTQRPERVKIRNITLAPGKGGQVVLERPLRTS